MKFAKKTIGLLLTVIMISGLFGNMMIEAKTQDAKATSITFKTSTGGDFVTGVCKMKITFLGANHQVTGSKTLVEWNENRFFLIDYSI